ncbi:MAG: hypothetical protein J0M16_04145, partial [Gammaproteobacteria bacterium]|nr:hypothetical protein [Gammaproteobacteria bacterium]
QIRGEGLPEEECVRAVALPRPIFAQLERAAGMQDDLDQVQYALAGAITALPRDSKAKGLLTAAAGAGKLAGRALPPD